MQHYDHRILYNFVSGHGLSGRELSFLQVFSEGP